MKVQKLLELVDTDVILSVIPEGSQIVDMISPHFPDITDLSHHTARSILGLINSLPDTDRIRILSTELNDGLDLLQHQSKLENLISKVNNKSKTAETLLVIGMATLTAIITIGYVTSLMYVAYHQKTLPGWSDLFLFLIIPGMVIWKYTGVSMKDKEALLNMVLKQKNPFKSSQNKTDVG